MQSVWEADNADFRKRKRVARACGPCQRRKKRCTHVFQDTREASSVEPPESITPSDDEGLPEGRTKRRFISDLNPESYLMAHKESPSGGVRLSHIGVFIEEESRGKSNSNDLASATAESDREKSAEPLFKRDKPGQIELRQYLEAVGALRTLPKATQKGLVDIYFSKIHPLLLLFEGHEFKKSFADGTVSTILINGICLVACKSADARPFLRLTEGGPLLSSHSFATELYHGIVAAYHGGMFTNRVLKTQMLALLSLHIEGVGGIEDASMYLSCAIHCATKDAMHLHFAGRKEADDSVAALFWTLWTMDKVNNCIAGQPVVIHDRDIGIGRSDRSLTMKRRAFDIWYDLSAMLEKIIHFYRPVTALGVTGWEEDYPSFEAIVGVDLEENIAESTFAVLELYYEAITIVACRADNPATASYSRQALAALRIQTLLTVEHVSDLAPLPLIPYAASLALSVAYRHLRKAEIPSRVRTAVSNLRICTELLERLSKTWWSAVAMAKLGRKILEGYGKDGRLNDGLENARAKIKPPFKRPGKSRSSFRTPENSLDILSTAAEAHGKSRPNPSSLPDTQILEDTALGTMGGLQPSATEEIPQVLPDNFFEDFDALFGDYLDVSLPTNYPDTHFFDEDRTLP